MDKTIERNRTSRNAAVFGLIITVPVVMACAYAIEGEASDRMKPVLWVLLSLYAAWLILSSCWLWLSYRRSRLTIRDGAVTCQGVWKCTRIALPDVEEARWSPAFGGMIRLRTRSDGINVLLSSCSVDERRALVRFFREAIDPSRQKGWNLFAYKVTSGYAEDEVKPAKKKEEFRPEDYVLVTRRRWDVLFGVLLAVFVVPTVAASWYFRSLGLFVFVMGFLLVGWLSQRLGTPAEGRLERRLMAPDESMRQLYALAGWSMLTLVGMLLAEALIQIEWLRGLCTVAFGLTWFTALCVGAYREHVEHKRGEEDAVERAAARREWRAME